MSVYVNPRDFHRTYNQVFAFLLPTWGFVIRKSCKIKFTSHPTEAEVEVCSPNFSCSQLCCGGDVSLSAGIIRAIVAVYLPNGNGYHCIRGASPCLVLFLLTMILRTRVAFLCSKGALGTTKAAGNTSLISSEFYLVKMPHLIFSSVKIDTIAGFLFMNLSAYMLLLFVIH